MNKTKRLSKSGIDYLDYGWTFYSGCHNWENGVCPIGENCWARKITKRFKSHYPNGFEPTFYPEAFLSPLYLKKPSIIGCAFMGDLFGDWVDPDKKIHSVMPSGKASISMSLKGWIFTTIEQCPQHKFLFLTKCPQNLLAWSPFSPNCFVGVTATDVNAVLTAMQELFSVKAKVKFLSLEPLLGRCYGPNWENIDWLIIGACTGTKYQLLALCQKWNIENKYQGLSLEPYGKIWTLQPKLEWVEEIVEAADKAGIPIFLKDNLKPLFANLSPIDAMTYNFWEEFKVSVVEPLRNIIKIRQEMPNG